MVMLTVGKPGKCVSPQQVRDSVKNSAQHPARDIGPHLHLSIEDLSQSTADNLEEDILGNKDLNIVTWSKNTMFRFRLCARRAKYYQIVEHFERHEIHLLPEPRTAAIANNFPRCRNP
jgi:hypothetical protein